MTGNGYDGVRGDAPCGRRLETKSTARPLKSLHAVVDRDGDHAHDDGERRHADEEGPDAAKLARDMNPIWTVAAPSNAHRR
jgi:hypothetical protein